MSVETTIKLSRFKPREYQLPIFDAIENKGYKRVLAILPRRAGKDVCAFNLCLRQALRNVGVYYYVFPTYSQAKKVIWDSMTNDGQRFLDYIPEELIESKNSQEMKIKLSNQSLIQLVGSDNFDSLMGTTRGALFSRNTHFRILAPTNISVPFSRRTRDGLSSSPRRGVRITCGSYIRSLSSRRNGSV